MPRAFEIISLAFGHDHAYVEALWPDHDTPSGNAAGAERLLFAQQNQPWARFCKAVDIKTGEFVGFAKWDFYEGVIPDVPTHMPEKYYVDKDENDYADYMWNAFTRRRWDAVRESGGKIACKCTFDFIEVGYDRPVKKIICQHVSKQSRWRVSIQLRLTLGRD